MYFCEMVVLLVNVRGVLVCLVVVRGNLLLVLLVVGSAVQPGWVQPGEGEQPKKLISDPTLCSPAEGAKFQL